MAPVNLKPQSLWRWPILVLACLMLVGSYYCFDIPSALKQQIDDYLGDPGNYETMFSLTYTLYAAPNVILPFFGGYFVDRLGVRVCLLVFTSLIAIGQVIFSIGISIKSWPVILLGRLVFGFGGESLTVANSALLADWFRGRELAFSFGVNLSVAKLGSVINNMVSPALAKSVSVVFACWFGAIICGASVICVVLTMPIDRYMDEKAAKGGSFNTLTTDENQLLDDDNKERLIAKMEASQNPLISDHAAETEEEIDLFPPKATQFRDVFTFKPIFWFLAVSCVVVYGCVLPFNNISASFLLERDYFKTPPLSCHLLNKGCQSTTNTPVDCPTSKWYQPPLPVDATVDGTFYSGALPQSAIDCTSDLWSGSTGCTEEYCSRLNKAESKTSVIMSIPYIISGVVSPFLGLAIDFYGQRATIACLAPAILIIVHMMLGFTDVSPVGPLVGQGLAYTGFAAVLWPAVPLVVEERLTGLAFGVITSLQNLGSALFPLVVASIYNNSGDRYVPNVELLFVSLGIAGFLVGLYMNYYDYHNHSILNRPCPPEEVVDAIAKVEAEQIRRSVGSVGDRARSISGDRNGLHHRRSHSRSKSTGGLSTATAQEEALFGGAFDHVQAIKYLAADE